MGAEERWQPRVASGLIGLALLVLLVVAPRLPMAGAAGAFGLGGLALGAAAQFLRPTTPGSRRVFAAFFALLCLVLIATGRSPDRSALYIGLTLVGGWTIGLGVGASYQPRDDAKIRRSFSGEVLGRD